MLIWNFWVRLFRTTIHVFDLSRPGESLLSSSLDLPSIAKFRAVTLFSPDLGLLLVNNLLYHLNYNDKMGKVVSNIIPGLPGEYERNAELPICIFSSCEKYVAIAFSSLDDDHKPVTLDVYGVSLPNGEIHKLDISLMRLEILTGTKIAGIRIDFHPDQPKLGVAYWAANVEDVQIRCLILDLPSMGLEHLQAPIHKAMPLICKSKTKRHPKK